MSAGLRLVGGISAVARSIERALEEAVDAGALERLHRLAYLDERSDTTTTIGRSMAAGGSRLRFIRQLWQICRAERPDLMLFDHYGLARALELPIPRPPQVVIFTHGLEFEGGVAGSRARALRGADRLLANSAFSVKQLRLRAPGPLPEIEVVPLCIEPTRETAWRESGQPQPASGERPIVLTAVRLDRINEGGKGHETLIEAWPAVVEHVPHAELWIAGSGDDQARLREEVMRGPVASQIRFLGQLDGEALSDRFRQASIYAMPSRQEGFGIAFAEAMWHGLPCIGTTADAAGETIGPAGVLVPFGDAAELSSTILSLMSDAARRRTLGAAGQARVEERYTYARFRDNFVRVIGVGPGGA